MPNTVRISKTVKYLEYAFYITCLCLIIPVKIDHHVVEKNLDYEKYLDQFNKTYDNVTTYQTRLDAYKVSVNMFIPANFHMYMILSPLQSF